MSAIDLNNVQGDILEGLPKKGETFLFFRIEQVQDFCTQLLDLIPFITTAAQVKNDRERIATEKRNAAQNNTSPKILDMSAINIAFSQKGLEALSINDLLEDGTNEPQVFTKGMVADAPNLKDHVDENGQPIQWEEGFKQEFHGVILVTGSSRPEIKKALVTIDEILGTTIAIVHQINGHTRPGDISGHEHFGFADGISHPLVEGYPAVPHRGQEVVNTGVILVGRQGDPAAASRPRWSTDGSFLCFRKLQQLVPEFDQFLEDNALPGENGKELLGARLVGRWKSGAPVDLSDKVDNPALGADPSLNDAFRYDPKSQARCPFAAHTRKTNPRSDLDFFGGTEARRILRRGIQFGPEVTKEENAASTSSTDPKLERGLLFVCYQSSLSKGFQFIQQSWANNAGFPFGKNDGGRSESAPPVQGPRDDPAGTGPGFDPIIGVSDPGTVRFIVGTVPDDAGATTVLELKNAPTPLAFDNIWVVPKGGEYFFSPSISALQETFAQAA